MGQLAVCPSLAGPWLWSVTPNRTPPTHGSVVFSGANPDTSIETLPTLYYTSMVYTDCRCGVLLDD